MALAEFNFGALGFSLGASDKGRDDVLDPFLATVFLQVDGGKAYAADAVDALIAGCLT